jgi:MIP family channel proteins
MIATTGHISGAHLNPAVTVAFSITRHFSLRSVPVYISAQILGGVLGALVLRAILGEVANLGATVPSGAVWRSLVVEVLISAALIFVIMAVATDTRAIGQLAAIMIGATVAVNALWAGPISGASMNPARSFGPTLVSNTRDAHWIYWVGTILGAVMGALAYQVIREPNSLD